MNARATAQAFFSELARIIFKKNPHIDELRLESITIPKCGGNSEALNLTVAAIR
jgi:hypothetical protein